MYATYLMWNLLPQSQKITKKINTFKKHMDSLNYLYYMSGISY